MDIDKIPETFLSKLIQQVFAPLPEAPAKSLNELIEQAHLYLKENNLFQAQLNINEVIARAKGKKNCTQLQTANSLLKELNKKCDQIKLRTGDTFTYTSPIQIGNYLWICSFDHLPEHLKDRFSSKVGYFLIDTLSLVTEKYKGYKGLRSGDKVYINKLTGTRFDNKACSPNEEIVVLRESDEIKILDPASLLNPQQIITNASYIRLLAARHQMHSQLYRGELKELQEEANYTKAKLNEVNNELIRRITNAIKRTHPYKQAREKGEIEIKIVSKGNNPLVSVTKNANESKIILNVSEELIRGLAEENNSKAYKETVETLKQALT